MSPRPPALLRRLLGVLLPPGGVRDGLLGDLDELYAERAGRGRVTARLWYARQALSAALRYGPGRLRPRGLHGRAGALDGVGMDLAYAARAIRANPAFASATVVTLALGIGSALMLHGHGRLARPAAAGIVGADRLVYAGKGPAGCRDCLGMASGDYGFVRERARGFERLSMFAEWEPTLRGADGGELLDGLLVTPDLFATLGVRPLLGRLLTAADGTAGNDRVVVLGEAAWRRRLGGDSTVIGRDVILDRVPYTVVGVLPAQVVFPHAADPTEVWAPIALTAELESQRTGGGYQVVGRLGEGTSVAAASAELADLAARSDPEAVLERGETYLARSFFEERDFGAVPPLLLATVGLVLLITWSNLTGLFLARLSARRRELAVRGAMGAGGARIVRQLLAESMLMSLLGALAGVVVAVIGSRWVLASVWRPDPEGFVLAFLLAIGSGLAIGTWPALRVARPSGALRLGPMSRAATGGIDAARGRRGLIVAEVALATMLLSAAGLLARSFRNVEAIEPGFDAERVLALRVWDPPAGPDDEPRAERVRGLVQAFDALPGVERAGAVLGLPFGLGASAGRFEIEDDPAGRSGEPLVARMQAATPGYFPAMGIPLLRGRDLLPSDGAGAPRVAIINEAAARAFFQYRDPIGRGLLIDGSRWEIVGVVGTVFHGDQEEPASAEVYRPMEQWAPASSVWFALRARGDPTSLGREVVTAVRRVDPDAAVTRVVTMDGLRSQSMGSEETMLRLMAAFALAAVLMSAVGLYGLISYSVSQRTREFGVRTALGAPAAAVLRLVVGEGVRLAAAGAMVGIVGAVAALRLIRSLLYGVSPTDPVTLGAVAAMVCVTAALAVYVPARRATRVDPLASLSGE